MRQPVLAAIKAGRASGLLRAVGTLLMGGALAQVVPLLLGPVLTRLYTPAAFGVFTTFSSVAATVAVVACARYEFALPLARDAGEARALFTLCLWICGAVALLAVPLAAVLHATGHLPLHQLLPLAVAAAGLLQLLVMWATRAQVFRALAISRVLQYGGAAVLQVLLGGWLWQRAQQPAGADAAWGLVLAQVCAVVLALLPLLPSVPSIKWHRPLRWPWQEKVADAGQAACRPAEHSTVSAPAAVAAPTADIPAADAPAIDTAWRADAASLRQVAWRYRDFPLLNTPHAFLGALQDAAAVAILVAYSGHAAAGFWGLALRYLKAPATLVGSAVSQALYPRLAQATPDVARQTVRQVMAVLGVLALGLMALLMLAGPWLFQQVFGPGWREAGYLARALAPYIAAHFVAAPLSVVPLVWNAQKWALKLAFVGQIVFIVALYVGLQVHGVQGGAWGVSIGMAIYFLYFFYRLATWSMHEQADRAM